MDDVIDFRKARALLRPYRTTSTGKKAHLTRNAWGVECGIWAGGRYLDNPGELEICQNCLAVRDPNHPLRKKRGRRFFL